MRSISPIINGETRPSVPRSRGAWIGVVAVLFQAILFGWHHHDLRFAHPTPWPVLTTPMAGDHAPPDADADGCEICIALHHQSATPIELPTFPAPPQLAATFAPAGSRIVGVHYPRGFRSRAPPRS